IAQIYRVAKLADGNCWMLDNLKLGGTTTTTTLTPADSDVSQNFILPQVASAHAFIQLDKDVAYVWGPVPGDTGEGSTNYGYLYSWTAVTAGATRTTNPAGSGNASSSICAAGWKLPSGGAGGDYSKLDIAFGGAGSGNNFTPSYQEWQYTGPFKGVFSGAYWPPINPGGTPVTGTYVNQGIAGRWWTATADATNGDTAYRAGINTTYNSPAYPSGGQRYDGAAVRCVLQL
ncbi:MAG TPA: FISUMP domain-containing protein, partial [Candidatus Saccharibacteria bacterium]|nr:FISUMP domain-containing protein [Candidatus Saccharibacteria bacterium]